MKKINYMSPFIEVIPTELDELLKNHLSGVDDGQGGKYKFGKDDTDGRDGMAKEGHWGMEDWSNGWDKELW